MQCFGSVFRETSWIRIRMDDADPDPDPGGKKQKYEYNRFLRVNWAGRAKVIILEFFLILSQKISLNL